MQPVACISRSLVLYLFVSFIVSTFRGEPKYTCIKFKKVILKTES